MIALVFVAIALFKWFSTPKYRSAVTDEDHRAVGDISQDVAMGLQAAPEMMQQHGGEHRDTKLQSLVDQIGAKLVKANSQGDWASEFNQYKWDFHLLADEEMINAFALPGGQVFFTYGLLKHLKSEDEVAGVMGHEIGHVIARHSAQQMAKNGFIGGLVQAGTMATAGDGGGSPQMAQMVGKLLSTRYGRGDETQSDKLGVQFMMNAGYNPQGLIKVMEILAKTMGGSGRPPEYLSSHPNPENRIEAIQGFIEQAKQGTLMEAPK
jgi:beta-barrel assembly-enhancing protease